MNITWKRATGMAHWTGACVIWAAFAQPAHAQQQAANGNGSELVASCRADSAACGAYLQGVLDMMIMVRRDECAAPRYDRGALRTAYLRWADANSYFSSVHMVAGAERALSETWPCSPRSERSIRK